MQAPFYDKDGGFFSRCWFQTDVGLWSRCEFVIQVWALLGMCGFNPVGSSCSRCGLLMQAWIRLNQSVHSNLLSVWVTLTTSCADWRHDKMRYYHWGTCILCFTGNAERLIEAWSLKSHDILPKVHPKSKSSTKNAGIGRELVSAPGWYWTSASIYV